MSDTINAFIQFITDDPLMLGLCIAIIVLIIIFILVLAFGKSKKQKTTEEKDASTIDNTQSLLKTEDVNETLKSTQEFNVNAIQNNTSDLDKTINVPELESVTDSLVEKEAPINIDDAMNLKNSREDALLKNTIEVPVTTFTEPEKVEVETAPVMPDLTNFMGNQTVINEVPSMSNESPVVESPVIDTPIAKTPSVLETPIVTNPIMENSMPIENSIDDELPTMVSPIINEDKTSQFSSIYVNGNTSETAPVSTNEDFSKTEIIRHVPIMEPTTPDVPADDDLPKLNVNSDTSVLKTLSGESFNIN